MAVSGPGLFLSVCVFAYVIVSALVEGRTLRLRHGHHSRPDYYDVEESMPRHLSTKSLEEREDELDYGDFYRRTERRGDPKAPDRFPSLVYEDAEERASSARRYRNEYGLRSYESSRRRDEGRGYSATFGARRKRHNKHGGVSYRKMTSQDWREILLSKRFENEQELFENEHIDENEEPFELEVKEAQNSSICNYTVVSIPDHRGSRVPKDLEHVKCNHAGSSCQDADSHCCIQTYRRIEVSYGDGTKETMKIYVGCVCALQARPPLVETQLSIRD